MRHLNRFIFSTTLLLTVMTGEAVQLGSVKGSAVFGRPLDLRVQVRLEATEEEVANCFSAEIFQADNKFDVGRILLDVIPTTNKLEATIRIRSITAVSEPWAKLILRSNCGAKVSRQYDFLTDFPTETPNNLLAEIASVAPVLNTVNTATAIRSNSPTTHNTDTQVPISDSTAKQSTAKNKPRQQKSDVQITRTPPMPKVANRVDFATTSVVTKKTSDSDFDAAVQSRLKMETFQLTDEHQVLLKLSTALVAPAAIRTPDEAQALAQATAVWRAINGMPIETKTIDTATPAVVSATQTGTVQTPAVAKPTSINQKLAGKSEFSNLIVYGLISLLALTLACIAWLWLRVRKASRAGYEWLNDSEADEVMVGHEPTQFMHTNFYETNSGNTTRAQSEEALEPSFDTTADVVTEIKDSETSNDVISIEVEAEVPQVQAATLSTVTSNEKSAFKASIDPQIVSALPPHFDDPRLEERVIHRKAKNDDATHAQPAPAAHSAESMDFTLEDIPQKIRAPSTSSTDEFNKSFSTHSSNKTSLTPGNDDDGAESNLIDFDAFAEPEPLNKSTRFIR
ncbi:MAG: hypothetical protein RL535_1206 [Pseudomonadota bacterium]